MAIQTLTVTGEGTYSPVGWGDEGGNYTRLQTDDGDTSRLYTPTNGSTRTLTHTPTSGLSGATINSVTVYVKVRNLNPIDSSQRLILRIGGVNYDRGNVTNSGTAYVLLSTSWTQNPATGAAWTAAAIDTAEFGMSKQDGIGTGWTYAYMEVDYTGGGGGGSTGQVKVNVGGSFVAKPVKVWNGSSWVTKPLKRYNGTAWVPTSY